MSQDPLYLLDVYGIVYRSYFAFLSRPLRNSSGANVSAVYGFFKFLFALFDQRKPRAFAALFDSRGKTFRHQKFEQYKATRQKTPEDLISQVPIVEEALKALGLPLLRVDSYEADDLIACLARRCEAEDRPCYIISGDKDLLQLVGGSIKALRPHDGMTIRELGIEDVKEEWGVEPKRILDFLSLTGDASDNVPGVPGVGEKTALKLLAKYADLDDIYANLDSVQPESLKAKLVAGRDSAYLSRELITLVDCLDLGLSSLEDLSIEGFARAGANGIFQREGMRSLVQAGPIAPSDSLFSPEDLLPRPGPQAEESKEPRKPSYEAILKAEDLSALIDACISGGVFAFDTETDSLQHSEATMIGFSLCREIGKAYYIPLVCPDAVPLDRDFILGELKRLCSSPALLVGQNLKYDLHVLNNLGIKITNPLFDTMIAAWLIAVEMNSFSLESLAQRLLGIKGISYGEVVPKGTTFAHVGIQSATAYAAEDADFTFRVYLHLQKELEKENLSPIFRDMEMPLLPILAAMEARGIAVNPSMLRAYGVELERELKAIEAQVWDLVGHPFNLASTKQLQDVLFVERKLPMQKRTKTGFSTDTSVLEDLAPLDPVPKLILRNRTLAKLKNTYVDTLAELAEKSGRVHTTYLQTGAATGRLSSKDPNLQNIPIRDEEGRRIRAAFTASEGSLLISADYAQIELAVMAHLSGDRNLIQAFIDGVDIHRRTAAFIFGVDEAQIVPDQRRVAKTINFGVIYGMSAFRLARDLGIPNGRAQGFIDAYFSTYSGVADFIQRTIEETEASGYVTTMFGRRRKIEAILSKNKTERQAAQRVAVNTPIQGSAADIVKRAMLAVDLRIGKEMPELSMLLQVHDELVFEAPESLVPSAAAMIRQVMESAAILSVPLRVSIETARSWGEMH
ncbi:MAG: DNA polymerase I [Spirochaetes bacterium]|nr:MAG: DNA polymerase I [Spirochaetota bacterium]